MQGKFWQRGCEAARRVGRRRFELAPSALAFRGKHGGFASKTLTCYNNNNYFIWEYKQKCNWQLLIQYPSLQFCQLCRLGHCMRSCQLHFCLYSQIKIHQALSNFNFFTAPQSVIRWPVPLGNSQSWLTTQSTITVRQHLSLLGNIFYKESSRFY